LSNFATLEAKKSVLFSFTQYSIRDFLVLFNEAKYFLILMETFPGGELFRKGSEFFKLKYGKNVLISRKKLL
jgi:hypothetical protein